MAVVGRTHRTLAWTSAVVLIISALTGCDPFGFEPAIVVCDILADTGCEEGSTCINIKTPECVPAGTVTHGGGCIKDEDCAVKHLCVESEDGTRTCQRRCNLRKPSSCREMGEAEGSDALKQASCLWLTDNGARDLGYCSSPQCVPASNEGCTDQQKCIGGLEPRCVDTGGTLTIQVDGEDVPYKTGESALGAPCTGPGHCVIGGVCAGVKAVSGVEQKCLRACKISLDDKRGSGTEKCQPEYICKELTFTPPGNKQPDPLPDGQGFCALEHCNLVSNEGCAKGEKCIGTGSGIPGCTLPGNTELLGKCDQLSDCDASTTCVSGGSKALCVLKCDTSGTLVDKGCTSDQVCSALKDKDGKAKPNHLGFCVPK